jgi:thioredoxin 1
MKLSAEVQAISAIVEVNAANFEEQVLKADLPVIVDFGADWCPPCRVLAPLYARLSQEYVGKVRFTSLDADDEQTLPIQARYGIQGLPTLLIFHQGQVVARMVGPHPARLKAMIASQLEQHHLL